MTLSYDTSPLPSPYITPSSFPFQVPMPSMRIRNCTGWRRTEVEHDAARSAGRRQRGCGSSWDPAARTRSPQPEHSVSAWPKAGTRMKAALYQASGSRAQQRERRSAHLGPKSWRMLARLANAGRALPRCLDQLFEVARCAYSMQHMFRTRNANEAFRAHRHRCALTIDARTRGRGKVRQELRF